MGLVFKTEPTEQERYVLGLQEQIKTKDEEIAKLNEFLELVGRGHLYDLWKDGLYTPGPDGSEGTFAEVIE